MAVSGFFAFFRWLAGLGFAQCRGCVLDGLGDGDDAVEAGGVEEARERGAVAADGDVAAELTGAADAPDQGAEPGGVDEGDAGHVDENAWVGGELREGLAELTHRESIELADRSADDVAVGVLELDVEQECPPGGGHGRRFCCLACCLSCCLAAAFDRSCPAGVASQTIVKHVLVASDSAAVREDVKSVLRPSEYAVREVSSGAAVLSAVLEEAPDLVVCDMQIGNKGGMAVCLDLRHEESAGRLPRVAVLLLVDRRPDVFLARRSEADGFLVKPLDPLRLRRAITAVLSGDGFEDSSYLPASSAAAAAVSPSGGPA